MKKGVAILGSTGSIGNSALRVLNRQRDSYVVRALTAFNNRSLLAEQESLFGPSYVGVVSDHGEIPAHWHSGESCLTEAAIRDDVDVVLNAVVGAAGLDATIAALRAGKRVALANKESLVVAGDLVLEAQAAGGGEIVPVDSEHSAILQCIAGRPATEVRRIVLTASGGPFRGFSSANLDAVTVEDALKHPTWSMGKKISVDSATLANKALEVIEAHYLFGVPYENISVVVHPQSVIHSFVEFVDGSVLAQLGQPSMEIPILYALTHPDRISDNGLPPFDPIQFSPLTFEAVEMENFPTLALGIEAGKSAGVAPAVFNAANEEAVTLFLNGRLPFREIPVAIKSALTDRGSVERITRESISRADANARRHVLSNFGKN